MGKYLLPLLLFVSLHAEPWGKDADLAFPQPVKNVEGSTIPVVAELMIKFHQNVISPADGPRSHFVPSSSQYTLQSMKKYGFFRGFIMGCDRLMRENSDPWIYKTIPGPYGHEIKYNPVP